MWLWQTPQLPQAPVSPCRVGHFHRAEAIFKVGRFRQVEATNKDGRFHRAEATNKVGRFRQVGAVKDSVNL
jgi:hypothetical protein